MTKRERNRRSRRVLLGAMGASGVLHVAALLWVALPVPELSAPTESVAMLAPLMESVNLELEVVTPPVPAVEQAPAAAAGHAGAPAEPAPPRPAPRAPTPDAAIVSRPVAGEAVVLAAVDSVTRTELMAQPAAETAPVVVAALPAAQSADAGQAAAPAPRKHVPGSAAKAKGGGKAVASAQSGGFGGITIKIGGGKKKHPPRGMPGRGRW